MSGHLVPDETPTPALIAALQGCTTCSVANAIETFSMRLRNQGFSSRLTARLRDIRPMVGHAVTARIACSAPPPHGHVYFERTTWWDHILSIPAPRVVVIQDIDSQQPGLGSFIGKLHADILYAMNVVGLVTNGAVRDLDRMEVLAALKGRFQVFSGNVSPSHAYAHLVSIGGPVVIDGMTINSGDLLHGDRHGVVMVPSVIAADIPDAVQRRLQHERSVAQLCRSSAFSPKELRDLLAREHPDLPFGVGEVVP